MINSKISSNKRSQTIISNVDQKIRSGIQDMWLALPEDADFEDLKRHIDRLVSRALDNFKEDLENFPNQ